MGLKSAFLKSKLGKNIDKPTVYTDGDGLSVRHSRTGVLAFQLRTRLEGKEIRVPLGNFPDVSLLEARNKAAESKAKASKGNDPREEEEAVNGGITFHELFVLWYSGYALLKIKNYQEVLASYKNHLQELLGDRVANDVTTSEGQEVIVHLLNTKSKDTAKRSLGLIKQVYTWGYIRNHVSCKPLDELKASQSFGIKSVIRERVLQGYEIRLVLNELRESQINERRKIYFYLCLLYGNRSSELRLTEIGHLDFQRKIWTVPAENHKTGGDTKKPIIRPLIPETEAMFKRLIELTDSKWLFPPEGKVKSDSPAGRSTMNNVCYKLRDKLLGKGVQIDSFSMHDLRKTQRTNMSTLCEYHVAEKMLGHSLGSIAAAYDHELYLSDMAGAISAWLERLKAFKDGNSGVGEKVWPPNEIKVVSLEELSI